MTSRITVEFTDEAHQRLKILKRASGLSSQSDLVNVLVMSTTGEDAKKLADAYRSAREAERERRSALRSQFNQLTLEEQERLLANIDR